MRFYIGPQVGLGEFEFIDISISWAEPPLFLSKVTVVGNDKVAVVYFDGDEESRVEDFTIVEYESPFLVAVGDDAIYPEVFHYAKKNGAKFAITFERTSGMGGLMMFKYRSWAHSQESGLIIFGIAEVLGKIHYGVYAPIEKTEDGSGILIEGSSPTTLEVSV